METINGTEHKQNWNDVPHKCHCCGRMFYAKYIDAERFAARFADTFTKICLPDDGLIGF